MTLLDTSNTVVEETWYQQLEDPDTFYTEVSALDLFAHLRDTSGGRHATQFSSVFIATIKVSALTKQADKCITCQGNNVLDPKFTSRGLLPPPKRSIEWNQTKNGVHTFMICKIGFQLPQ